MSKRHAAARRKRQGRRLNLCSKGMFYSREEAEKKMAEIQEKAPPRARVPVRVYRCHRCPFWHLTSQERPTDRKQAMSV